jgi:hypothetical protein
MYRAISETEETEVRLLVNSTADKLGIPRPLDAAGWYEVKEYLRSQSAAGVPEDWTREYAWIHSVACSNLVIDPERPRKGLMVIFGPMLSWILSPADRHGVLSELLRGTLVAALAGLFGLAAVLIAHLCGSAATVWPCVVGSFVGVFALSMVISSDTATGAQFLLVFLGCVYSLATVNWALAEWFRILASCGGAVFAALVLATWLS